MSTLHHTATPFTVELDPRRETIRVVVRGELDVVTAPELEGQVLELRDAGFERIELDLTALGFMDSSGVALLLRLMKTAGRDRLAIEPGDGQPLRALQLTGTADVLPLVASRRFAA